jgi:hypothetical protein
LCLISEPVILKPSLKCKELGCRFYIGLHNYLTWLLIKGEVTLHISTGHSIPFNLGLTLITGSICLIELNTCLTFECNFTAHKLTFEDPRLKVFAVMIVICENFKWVLSEYIIVLTHFKIEDLRRSYLVPYTREQPGES